MFIFRERTYFLFLKMILNPKHIKINSNRTATVINITNEVVKSVGITMVIGVPSGGIPSYKTELMYALDYCSIPGHIVDIL